MNLYKQLSTSATNFFIKNGTISTEKKDVYAYGFEILISTIVYTGIFLMTAFITDTFLLSIVFWIGFYIVRTIAGGYHAKTYIACHLLFMCNHLLFIIILKTRPTEFDSYIALGLFIVSAVTLILFAPVEHPNKPFIKTEKKRFRKLSCFYSIFVIIIGIIFLIINDITFNQCVLGFAFGTFSAATALTIAKLKYKKEVINYENG